ncbi:hypothetical protein JJC00_25490 [Bradyrhizobium diazoefficiens]|uniref:asparagine synthase-related protein n=1 Tax=Bradyrhizobium diazoefficiens TaxID=1355477 RepID=UPI00190D667D|nr:hypothetical protein JJC00_25490 [Bradyrhizobium diazoefficiens]
MIDGALDRGRMPFIDTTLPSVVARFSDEFLIGGNGGRAVPRAAVGKVLPREIVRRKKVGSPVLHRRMVQRSLSRFVQGCWCAKIQLGGNHQPATASHPVSGAPCRTTDLQRIIWSLTNLEMSSARSS